MADLELERTALVHRVQRERGVTCGWIASLEDSCWFAKQVEESRRSTDLLQHKEMPQLQYAQAWEKTECYTDWE